MTSRRVVLSATLLLTACGPGLSPIVSEGGGTGSEAGGTGNEGSGSEGSSSSSGAPSECTEVVEGDLEITDASDFEWLRTVREVTGQVQIRDLAVAEDLSMLSCLDVVGDGLLVIGTDTVRSLHGLERLRFVGTWPDGLIFVEANAALETLAGLDGLEEIGTIRVWDNPNLSRLEVNAVKRLGNLMLGWVECVPPGVGGVAIPRGDNPKLTEIDGFEALESGALFGVYGQSGLVSLTRIVELSKLREAEQLKQPSNENISGTFELNSALPLSEINEFYAVRGLFPPYSVGLVCGNKDDPNVCECKGGE